MADAFPLPPNLPVPVDDGAAQHLLGLPLPNLSLPSTDGNPVNLAAIGGIAVIYCYPMTGRPGVPLLPGWDEIPGARGCTPQSGAYRDHFGEFVALGAQVFGVSTQSTDDQAEAATRLRLPYLLLSDADRRFAAALRLPTFEVEGRTMLKRLTMVAVDGTIRAVFYPVFPPDRDAETVIAWLKEHEAQRVSRPTP
jgi:peroxiredoxin